MTSAEEHRLADLEERGELIREGLRHGPGVRRPDPGHYVAYFSRAELLEELDEIAYEATRLRTRQQREALRHHSTPVRQEGRRVERSAAKGKRKLNTKVKEIAGAAVIVADILFGMALPSALREMHKQAHPHYAGVAVLYGFLAVATLVLLVSVVRALGAKAAAKKAPARRVGYPSYGGGQ